MFYLQDVPTDTKNGDPRTIDGRDVFPYEDYKEGDYFFLAGGIAICVLGGHPVMLPEFVFIRQGKRKIVVFDGLRWISPRKHPGYLTSTKTKYGWAAAIRHIYGEDPI